MVLSGTALAKPTTNEEKERKLIDAVLGGKNTNGIALAQDGVDEVPPLPYNPTKEDALAMLQAMKEIAKNQLFHFHVWAKAQNGGEDDDEPARFQERLNDYAKNQLFHFHLWSKAQNSEEDDEPARFQELMKEIAKNQLFHFHIWK